MSQQRYLISFLISTLAFVLLGLLFLSLLQVEKILKAPSSQVIKVVLISPIKPVEKVTKPTPEPIEKEIVPPTPVVKKVEKPIIKKPKPKKIIKKVKPKKVVKKVVKKSKPKVVPKKRVIPTPKPHYSTPAPIVQKAPKVTVAPKVSSDNGRAKRAFLRNVRAKIIANKKYPKIALRRHIEGAVKVRFDITQYGQIANIRFINGKTVFHKSIRKTLERTFPIGIPNSMKGKLPISDVSVILHFNIK